MRVRDMNGRAEIAREAWNSREGEGVVERREPRLRVGLRDIDEQRRRFGQHAARRDQRGHAALRVDLQIVGRTLLGLGEVDAPRLVDRAGVLQRDMDGERAGVRA